MTHTDAIGVPSEAPVSNAQIIAELRMATIAILMGLPVKPVGGSNE